LDRCYSNNNTQDECNNTTTRYTTTIYKAFELGGAHYKGAQQCSDF